jgi:magnesium chelatase subunit D
VRAEFPFTAIVGQDRLREALLACAVDPLIGGVLVRGERGTAKSTAVRALAPLLPAVEVVDGCAFGAKPRGAEALSCPDGPHPADAPTSQRPVRLVELPVGATADRLVGTLDLERALAAGRHSFQPGLLAAAHRGILYVDEVNLLPDHLVDVMLDAAAMGRNHVERDGVSSSHPARFLLVGTMNPEEGELRPQLLDRFGLSVEVSGSGDVSQRVEVVRRRLAYDADPDRFEGRFDVQQRSLAARIEEARARLSTVRLSERSLTLIAGTCARLRVDGMRADIVCARTATALAALHGGVEVSAEDIRTAAMLALGHRRRRGPLEAPGLAPGELDEAMREAGEAGPGGDDPDDDGRGGGPGGDGRGDGPGDDGRDGGPGAPRNRYREPAAVHNAPGSVAPTESQEGSVAAARETPSAPAQAGSGAQARDGSEAAAGPGSGAAGPDESGTASSDRPDARDVGPGRTTAPGAPIPPPLLTLVGAGQGPTGRRSASASRDGHPIDARPAIDASGPDLAAVATIRAAARRRSVWGGPTLTRADLHEHVRSGREGNLVVFCVDASGSMGARRRMASVKGAILGLLLDAYQRRDRVALVTFRAQEATLSLPPTASVERAAALLTSLPTGGGTPLAAGLRRAAELIVTERRRAPERRSLALVVTDGRASGGPAGREAALRGARALAAAAHRMVMFDAEDGRVRLGLAGALAAQTGAAVLPLAALDAADPPHAGHRDEFGFNINQNSSRIVRGTIVRGNAA